MIPRPTHAAILSAVLSLCLGGCAIGQDARPPALAELGLADSYGVQPNETNADGAGPVDLATWWRSFDDPVLTRLIERARMDNPDVQPMLPEDRTDPRAAGRPGAVRLAAGHDDRRADRLAAVRANAALEVARAYLRARSQQQMAANFRQFVAAQAAVIELARFRQEAKLVPELDGVRAGAERDRVAADIPPLEAGIARNLSQMAVLTGQQPGALNGALDPATPVPLGPDSVSLGKPSDLMIRRPDLRAAVRTRSGTFGLKSTSGQTDYRKAVLLALEEVEDRRATFEQAKARLATLRQALATAEQAATLARSDYRQGLADYSALEQAERTLLSVRNQTEQARAERAIALAELYVALGSEEPPQDIPAPAGVQAAAAHE